MRTGAAGRPSAKVALLFLCRGPLPLEPAWREFFHTAALLEELSPREAAAARSDSLLLKGGSWATKVRREHHDPIAAQDLFTVYVHPPPGYQYPADSLFAGREIADRVHVQWAQWSVAEAERKLLTAALHNPLNHRFMLLSESCIPIYPPHVVWSEAISQPRSRMHACASDKSEDMKRRNVDKWQPAMQSRLLQQRHWRKSNQWFLLNRKHAQVVSRDTQIASIFQRECYTYDRDNPAFALPEVLSSRPEGNASDSRACVADEHYVATLLAVHGLDSETDCLGQSTHAEWRPSEWSPHSYTPEEVLIQLTWLRREWFSDGKRHCAADAAIRSANDLFRRKGATGSVGTARGIRHGSQPASTTYQPLGPLCSLIARKFGAETVPALLQSGADCEQGFGWGRNCV